MVDSVRDAIDSIRSKLQAELETQLTTLADRQAAELDAARAAGRADVEQQKAAVRAACEAETERRVAEARASAQADFDRQAAEIRAAAEAEAERRVAAAKTAALAPGSLAHAFREIDAAASVSGILTSIGRAVASVSPRASLFVGAAASLERWSADGATARVEAPAVTRVMQTGSQSRAGGVLIVPLLLDGVSVGAVEAELAEGEASSTIEAIVRYGAARLASVTAMRTAQAQRWLRSRPVAARTGSPAPPSQETDGGRGLHHELALSTRRHRA
jgi:hypothetical protein